MGDHPDRIQIRRRPHLTQRRRCLLGRHVAGGPGGGAGPGEAAGVLEAGEAEVCNLDPSGCGPQQVLRFQVAVHHPRAVQSCKSLQRVFEHPAGGIRITASDQFGDRPSRHVLHHQEWGALMRSGLVDEHDVGVVELGQVVAFVEEPAHVGCLHHPGQDLDCDVAIEAHVPRQVDRRKCAPTQLSHNGETADAKVVVHLSDQ